jgi:pilus assembly protein Flp/PilA
LHSPSALAWHIRCDKPRPDAASRRASINLRRRRNIRTAESGARSSGEEIMSMLINYVKSFAKQEEGQDLLEYALLVALIALIAIGAVGMAGGAVSTIFTNIANALTNAA